MPHFPLVAHFSMCGSFFQVWLIFPRVVHFSNSGAVFQVCRIFPNVPDLSKCGALFQVCLIFPSLPHLFKCGALPQVWRSFPRVSHFSKCAALFQMCRTFPSVPHKGLRIRSRAAMLVLNFAKACAWSCELSADHLMPRAKACVRTHASHGNIKWMKYTPNLSHTLLSLGKNYFQIPPPPPPPPHTHTT